MMQKEEKEIEVGFVDGLFEMNKLRSDIAKARAELMAEGALQSLPILISLVLSFSETTLITDLL